MPWISIPLKLQRGYIDLCAKVNALRSDDPARAIADERANGYYQAIKDQFGRTVAGEICLAADMALPDDGRPVCCGVYLDDAPEEATTEAP